MDTPELGRLVVLLASVINSLLSKAGLDRKDPELSPVLREADALLMRVAHRSRSAIGYDDTARGRASLDDAQQLRDALADLDGEPPLFVELVSYTWDRDQLDSPAELASGTPRRKLVRRQFVGGMALLSDPDTPIGVNRAEHP